MLFLLSLDRLYAQLPEETVNGSLGEGGEGGKGGVRGREREGR